MTTATGGTAAADLGRALDRASGGRRAAARARLATLVAALRGGDAPSSGPELVRALLDELAGGDPETVWLTLAVLRAELPLEADVTAVRRAVELDGPLAAVRPHLLPSRGLLDRGRELREVEVVTGAVLVDVQHTAHTALATGIQRVARQTVRRWADAHPVTLVGWTSDNRAIRRLSADEERTALHGGDEPGRPGDRRVVVPWRSTYVLPELATEPPRTARMLAMARWSRSRTGVIGFDCVPLTSAETTGPGMGSAFANNLAAVRHMDRVAAISAAAAGEYRGWRRMLTGTGLDGPEVEPILLPAETGTADEESLERVRATLRTDELPLVLCVGSHEPRKNHLAVLHAADLAWRRGARFTLVFVGGNSWGADEFGAQVELLRAQGRQVETVSAISDGFLWAAYTLARAVVFPSLNEGFGLPVAEAIAAGTPVVTSDFGSMREIAAHGGALLVDPRDDQAIADAVWTLVTDDAAHARLAAEARSAPRRTWDEYADLVWRHLVADPA